MQKRFPQFSATLQGIMMDGMKLSKFACEKLTPETLRYIGCAEELLKTVEKKDWDRRTPHATHDIPVLAKAQMMLALASPQPYPSSLNRQLTKDASDDSNDEEDNSEDDFSSGDSNGGSSYSGGGHYNPNEPRVPAGYRNGGQWTDGNNYGPPTTATDRASISADNSQTSPNKAPASTREYQVTDSGQIMTDAVLDNGSSSDSKHSIAPGTLTQVGNIPLANSKTLPYFDASIVDQIYSFFEDAEDQEIPVVMTSGFRTTATQTNLTGNQYGGAAAGSSLHEAGFAFDVNLKDLTADEQEQILNIAADNGFEWGGMFTKPDVIHFYVDPFTNS